MRLSVECEDAVERPLPVSGDEAAAAAAAVKSERAEFELALEELVAADCGSSRRLSRKAADGRAASSVSAAMFRRGTLALDRDAAWAKRSAAAAAIAFCRDVRRWSAGGAASSSDE